MIVYKVEYYDEEEDEWITKGLEMCHGERLCEKCKKDPSRRDVCDYIWTWINDYEIAKDAKEQCIREGLKARITGRTGEEI